MQLKEFSLISPSVETKEVFQALNIAIAPEVIDQALEKSKSVEKQKRKLPASLVVCIVIAMSLWSEDRQLVSVSEIDNGMAFSVFEAQADSEGSKVSSQINDSAKLDILERFVEAEGEVLANVTTQPEQTPEPEKSNKEEPSLFL